MHTFIGQFDDNRGRCVCVEAMNRVELLAGCLVLDDVTVQIDGLDGGQQQNVFSFFPIHRIEKERMQTFASRYIRLLLGRPSKAADYPDPIFIFNSIEVKQKNNKNYQ